MSDPETPAIAERFGRYLAQQRELRGLSLQTVADFTKLSVSSLKALESEDFSHLPERVFLIGAVKAYARCVGLSVEETVLRLQEALGPAAEEPLARRRRNPRAVWFGALAAAIAVVVGAAWLLHHH